MPKSKEPKLSKTPLLKRGSALPTDKRYGLDSSHLKAKGADKREMELIKQEENIKDTKIIRIPKQYAVFARPRSITQRPPRISAKQPRIKK